MQFERPERKQIRLRGYDYSQDGYYFVTICMKDRGEFFGEIRNGIMGLNSIGNIATKFWREIPLHFDNVVLDEWVVMPNHVHGVLGIDNDLVNDRHLVGVQNFEPLRVNRYQNIIPKSLSSIIRAYKSVVTMWCNRNDHDYFKWQRSFYDHIIRNQKSLNNIREYIRDNPIKWSEDVANRNNQFSDKQIKQHYNNLF